jgi:hypothetical protein
VLTDPAQADGPDGAKCVDAYSKAQTLRNDKKLVEARAALLTCAQPTCKDFIVKDCTEWLDQIRSALPSVVAVAADPAGNSLIDVKVTMDGAPFVDKIDGRSVEVNPGPHSFRFQMADGTTADKQVMVAEGEHDKKVSVTLGNAPAGATPTPTPAAGGTAPAAGGEGAALSERRSPWKLVGLATAGVGLAGLATGSIFGIVAMSKKSTANSDGCLSNGHCPTHDGVSALNGASSAASLSTVFFIIGGVLTAGGVAVWALAPSQYVQVQPSVGFGTAGLDVKGAW